MKEIIVTTQKEMDELPKSFDEYTVIKIKSGEVITVYKVWDNSTVEAWDNSTVRAYDNSTVEAYGNSTVEAHGNSTVRAYDNSTVEAWDNSTVRAYDNSTVEAYSNSTVRAYLKAVVRCFSGFATMFLYDNVTCYLNGKCDIKHQDDTVNIVSDFVEPTFEQWLERGIVYADGIYKELISQKQKGDLTIFKVKDLGKESFVVKKGDVFSHGDTVKQAVNDLRFKLADRDKSDFEGWKLDDVKPIDEIIQTYRVITGACESGTREFCNRLQLKDEYKLSEIVEITKGAYGGQQFKEFLG